MTPKGLYRVRQSVANHTIAVSPDMPYRISAKMEQEFLRQGFRAFFTTDKKAYHTEYTAEGFILTVDEFYKALYDAYNDGLHHKPFNFDMRM